MVKHKGKSKTSGKLSEEQVLQELVAEEEAKLARKRTRGNIFWSLLGLLLIAVLVAQYYWFTQRDYVLQHAQVRPVLETMCGWFNRASAFTDTDNVLEQHTICQLPTTRDISQLKITKNFMGKHETQSDAVLLHLIFSNQAHFPQPYPGVEVRFEDENKKVIGIRRLAPQEYLNAGVDVMNLPPNEDVHVSLELHNAVKDMHTFGYAIHFL